jgi:hypothetical protein
MNSRELLSTAGISLAVSTFVVFVNNYFLYRHCCPKQSVAQPIEQPVEQQAEQSTK